MAQAAEQLERWFDVAGMIDAPAIVLVHGAVLTRKMWLRQLRDLSEMYFVIAPDLPGHGALAQMPFTFAAAADAGGCHRAGGSWTCAGRRRVAGRVRGDGVGTSSSGMVTGLVLSGCSLNARGLLGVVLKLVSAVMRRGWVTLNSAQLEKRMMQVFPPNQADVAEAQRRAGFYPEPVGFAFREMAGTDFVGSLAAFPGPTLILNGVRDWFSRTGERKCAAMSPRVRVQHLAGAGHACNLDQPEKFNQVVLEFAQSASALATAGSSVRNTD